MFHKGNSIPESLLPWLVVPWLVVPVPGWYPSEVDSLISCTWRGGTGADGRGTVGARGAILCGKEGKLPWSDSVRCS